MYREIINKLLRFPQRGQIRISFDLKKKVFLFKAPIFISKNGVDPKVKEYIEARKNLSFKPHATSFKILKEKVYLVTEVPFCLDFQSTFRKEVDHFWQMSRKCHQMLAEIAIEDTFKDALNLDRSIDQ